jgi:hypothetical protein
MQQSLVEQVVARVIEIQKKEAALKAEAEAASSEKDEVGNGKD